MRTLLDRYLDKSYAVDIQVVDAIGAILGLNRLRVARQVWK